MHPVPNHISMQKITIFLSSYRGGDAMVCRASCAVFYSVLRALGPIEWKVKVVQSFLAIFGFFSCCRRLYILWFSFLWSVLDEESVDSQLFVNKSNSGEKIAFFSVA